MNALPQIRDAVAKLLPPAWLVDEVARSFIVEGLLVLYDYDHALWRDILFNRMPSFCAADALPLLLTDRRLRRGPYEVEEAVRPRLRLWLDQWSLAGMPIGLMLAVQAYLAPEYPRIRIFTRGNVAYTLEEGVVGRMVGLQGYAPLSPVPGDGEQSLIERVRFTPGAYSRFEMPPGTWDWDSVSQPTWEDRWWHFWMAVYPPALPKQQAWNSGTWVYGDVTESWGIDAPFGNVLVLRQTLRDFSPMNSRCIAVVAANSKSEFDPTAPGAGWPDGTWGYGLVNDGPGQGKSARRNDLRYLLTREADL